MNGPISCHPLAKCAILVSIVMALSGCRTVERHVLYRPDRFPDTWHQPAQTELEGLQFEEAHFNSLDGTQLHGWFVKPADVETSSVILFAHGRTGNVSTHKTRLLEFVHRHQAAVLLFDYRGYGKSEGKPSESGLYQDAIAARNWLMNRMSVSGSEIVVMGRSLGAAVAIDLVARDGAKALIIESGFTSVPDMVRSHSRNLFTGKFRESSYGSIDKIGLYAGPVFISHGKQDKAIPFTHGIRLAQAATNAHSVQVFEVEGGHRSDPGQIYHESLREFLKRL